MARIAPLPETLEQKTRRSRTRSFLLEEHPIRLTFGELSLVLHAYPRLDNPEEVAKRAVRELVGAGLVHQDGRFLAPTRAAIYFERLRAG